jgi:hypothetical protein
MIKSNDKHESVPLIKESIQMVEYSGHESDVFGISFGRLNLDEHFSNWQAIQDEIAFSNYKYIRTKIKNPTNSDLDNLKELGKSAHLLEIVRSYTTHDLTTYRVESIFDDFIYVKVQEDTRNLFLQTFNDTYEDIPFGSYTPAVVLEKFSISLQRKSISSYFYNYYDSSCPEKQAYLIYNKQQDLVGCLTIDFFNTETYSYYVGVKKEFRKKDILLKTINFIHFTTQQSNLLYAKGSARLHNVYSQKAFDKSGMKCTGYDWIFLLEL